MNELRHWPAWKLMALHRVAKRTGFFRDPRDMIDLRRWSLDAQLAAYTGQED